MYARARVAITLAYGFDPRGLPESAILPSLHVGHARTLLIGSLAAREFGCPFHVRLDGTYHFETQFGRMAMDRGDLVLAVADCLAALGIGYDKMYWCPQTGASLTARPDLIPLKCGWSANEGHIGQILDDALDHAPSLMVRGTEFKSDLDAYSGGIAHLPTFVALENSLFKMLGAEKHELTVPMVWCDRGKMSKSKGNLVPWSVLKTVSRETARRFLLATALNPGDPLQAMDTKFTVDAMTTQPYLWDWGQWTQVVKLA